MISKVTIYGYWSVEESNSLDLRKLSISCSLLLPDGPRRMKGIVIAFYRLSSKSLFPSESSKEELTVRVLLSVNNAVSSSSSSSSTKKTFGRIASSIECCKLRIQHRLRNRFAMVPLIFGRVLFKLIIGGGEDVDEVDCGSVGVIGVDDVLDLANDDMSATRNGSLSVLTDDDNMVNV